MKKNILKLLSILLIGLFSFEVYTVYKLNISSNRISIDTPNLTVFQGALSKSDDFQNYIDNNCRTVDFEKGIIEYDFGEDCFLNGSKTNSLLAGKYHVKFNETKNYSYATVREASAGNFIKEYLRNDIKYLEQLSKEVIIKDSLNRPGDYINVDMLLGRLKYSNIIYNPPDKLYLRQDYPLSLLISRGLSKIELFSRLDSILGNSKIAPLRFEKIKSSAMLEVKLTGQSFSISSGSPEIQSISSVDVTRWKWIIKPMEVGDKHLMLSINAILNIDGKEQSHSIETFNTKIEVSVKDKFWYYVIKYQNYLIGIGTLLSGLICVYFGFWLNRNSKPKKL